MSCGNALSTEKFSISPVAEESKIIAIVEDIPIRRNELWQTLIHMNGQQALDEAVLDIGIAKELERLDIAINASDLHHERALLVEAFKVEQFDDIFDVLWETRSLSEQQVEQLIRRNAGLRKLVANSVHVTDEAIERMYHILHGPSAATCVVICNSREDIHKALDALQKGQSFSDVAKNHSVDPSKANGGLIGSVVYADPKWPAPLREQVKSLKLGSYSSPFLMDEAWVIAFKQDEQTGSGLALESVKEEVSLVAKRALERLKMDRLTEQILQTYQPTIYDDTLREALRSNRH